MLIFIAGGIVMVRVENEFAEVGSHVWTLWAVITLSFPMHVSIVGVMSVHRRDHCSTKQVAIDWLQLL